MSAEDPKRLRVRDRIIDVLQGIQCGEDYFFQPAKVFKVDVLDVECPGYPCYSVHPDSGGRVDELTDHNYDWTVYFVIKGLVKDLDDPGAAAIRASRDVVRALDQDQRSGLSGSLGELATRIAFPEPPVTDNGFFSGQGLAYFEQRVEVLVNGDLGEL